jgi:type IV secretion system protein VirB5
MFKRKETKGKTESNVSLPYLAARAEWDERYGSLLTRAKNWRTAFVIMGILACIEGLALNQEMRRSHVVPFVVAVDHLGHAVGQGMAVETTVADPRMIRAQLQEFVEYSRSVSTDQLLLKERLEAVFDWTLPQSEANGFLVDYYRKEDPFSVSKTGTTQVEVKNINQITGSSYEVSWVEHRRDNVGEPMSNDEWKGIFELVVLTPKDEVSAAKNPLGIFVKSISWSKTL